MALIFDGQFKGLADSKWSGVAGSFFSSVGIDGHSMPGALTVHQKLTKESGSTVTELCKVRVACSNGYSFWFSSTSGKIWARKSDGTWSLATTTTATAGGVNCLGAMEFDGYIYWATESRLHRIAVADADDSWASVSLNWATFQVTNSLYHPMAIQDLTLFIGDGNQMASVDDVALFNNNALDLSAPLIIKTIVEYEIDLLIGTVVGTSTTVNRTSILRWDCVSPSWNTSDPIEEVGINAFIRDDNYMYVNAGRAGNIYYYNGETLEPFKKVPGSYSNTAYGYVDPHAVGNFKGVPIFGFSNGSGNPAPQGVYSFGSYSKDYPKVLDLSWVISPDVVTSIEIGAILVLDFDILVAWQSGSSYGVDKIDYTAKYTNAYFETRKLAPQNREDQKTIREINAYYDSLPTGCGVNFAYCRNGLTATMTIANPAVVTMVAHGLSDGTPISFISTGDLPTGIVKHTTYYTLSTGADTFNLYDTLAHALAGGSTGRVVTSGSQSGIQTVYFPQVSINDTEAQKIYTQPGAEKNGSVQLKYNFVVSGNTAPVIEALGAEIE